MAGFFSVGMTKSEVMSKLGSTQATEKTKQFINNFWNTDLDGKVTNEIELTMLDSWASGSERVKMPTRGAALISQSPKTNNGLNISLFRSKSGINDTLEITTQTTNGIDMMTDAAWQGNGQRDVLFDLDCDGYADIREFKGDLWSVNASHKDENLDGKLKTQEEIEDERRKAKILEIKKINLDEPVSFDINI